MEDGLVCDLYRAIILWVIDGCESVPNVELNIKIFESLVVKLLAIVGDDGMRELVSIDYRLLEETLVLAFNDVHEGLSLHPLSEVVNCDDKKLSLSGCRGEGIKYIHPLFTEWLGGRKLA